MTLTKSLKMVWVGPAALGLSGHSAGSGVDAWTAWIVSLLLPIAQAEDQ